MLLGADQSDSAFCDECSEDTLATASCLDCDTDLCSAHARTHPNVRRTRGHKVGPARLRAATRTTSNQPCSTKAFCPLHSLQELTHFCKRCMDLSCSLCLKQKAHADHSSELLPIDEAAEETRKDITRLCSVTEEGCHSKLAETLESLKQLKDTIRSQSKEVSRDISAAIQEKIDILKRRETQLLADVDRLCWKKLEPLEADCSKLADCLEVLPHLANLSDMSAGDCDVLRLGPWLKQSAASVCLEAEKCSQPRNSSRIVCENLEGGFSSEAAGDIGRVFDHNAIDPLKSSIDIPTDTSVGQKLKVGVRLRDGNGKATADGLEYENVSIVARKRPEASSAPPATEDDIILTRDQSQESSPTWSCTFDAVGYYHIHVKYRRMVVAGSPVEALVKRSEMYVFDKHFCHPSLKISQDGTLVTNGVEQEQKSAHLAPMASGVHRLRLQFTIPETGTGVFPACGIVEEINRTTHQCSPTISDFIGLSSTGKVYDGSAHCLRRSGVVLPWRPRAVFTLHIDCDKGVFTLECHQPPGEFSLSWTNIPQVVCVKVGLFHQATSCEIVQ